MRAAIADLKGQLADSTFERNRRAHELSDVVAQRDDLLEHEKQQAVEIAGLKAEIKSQERRIAALEASLNISRLEPA